MLNIVYENEDWLKPLSEQLLAQSVPFKTIFLDKGYFEFDQAPESGVYFNRLSASATSRDHHSSLVFGHSFLRYLEFSGVTVINGSQAFALETNKWKQILALKEEGIRTPRTALVVGNERELENQGLNFGFPFIYKYNCGGKGLGVELFRTESEFQEFIRSRRWARSPDGVHLLQQYIVAPEPIIRRYEFIGGKFHYGIKVDTSEGFQLCPAEACSTDRCQVSGDRSLFEIDREIDWALVEQYERVLERNAISVCGIESIIDSMGTVYTYDINCNTNYAPNVESQVEVAAISALSTFLKQKVSEVSK